MNEELKKIFDGGVKVGDITVPAAHLDYKGSEKTYVLWTITGESPALSADDEDIYSVVSADIDVYSDGNYTSIVKAIKALMKQNGWIWSEDSAEMYEDETELYHKTVSFEKERSL